MSRQLNCIVFVLLRCKYLNNFCVRAVSRENVSLVEFNATLTGRSAPFTNATMETPPVITVDVLRQTSV